MRVEAPRDRVEVVARQLLAAVDEANAAYPEHYEVWRRARDARNAEEKAEQQRRFSTEQAILDRVMNEPPSPGV